MPVLPLASALSIEVALQAERSLWAAVLAEDMPRIAALSTEVEILTGAASTPAEGEPKSPGVSVEPPVSEEKEWVTCSALCCPLAAACCCDWLVRWCPRLRLTRLVCTTQLEDDV